MNKVRFILALMAIASTALWQACGSDQAANDQQEAATEQAAPAEDGKSGPEYTSAYVCPMHCKGSGSNQPGKCPVCGMEYVANPNHPMHQGKAGGANGTMQHSDSHEGHSH